MLNQKSTYMNESSPSSVTPLKFGLFEHLHQFARVNLLALIAAPTNKEKKEKLI
jgi:hypothetical protein